MLAALLRSRRLLFVAESVFLLIWRSPVDQPVFGEPDHAHSCSWLIRQWNALQQLLQTDGLVGVELIQQNPQRWFRRPVLTELSTKFHRHQILKRPGSFDPAQCSGVLEG